jgi:putative nucleotidyltransferase with HDIG domain
LPNYVQRLRRSEATQKWQNFNGWPISAAAGCRLVAHIEDKRTQIISTVLRSSASGQSFRSVASSVFINQFFDQLTLELETHDREPLDRWIDAALISGEASFYSRLVVVANTALAASYQDRHDASPEISSYLALRGHELASRIERNAQPAGTFGDVAPREAAVSALLATLDARDPGTAEHSRVVGALCGRIARELALSSEQQAFAELCGTLHDVGKVKTPREIILKPGPLSDDQWTEMHAHARIGGELLEQIPCLRDVAPIVRAHHERVDGRGYPDQLAGDAIPLAARIVAVADAFHTMAAPHNYREAFSLRQALETLVKERGSQFDARVVDALAAVLGANEIRLKKAS